MRFAPQTRVFCINKKYRSVFLVDVSSSVLTVDSEGSKVVMSQVMETLSKCLSGLAERFSCPGLEQDFVQSEIHITVIAECSQFASNLHTGEMLANFPTMKVLLQDVILTENNRKSVLKALRIQLEKFQSKLAKFRGELRRTREIVGYSLAVEDNVGDINTELDLEDDISQRKSWGVGLSGANLSYTLTAGLFALGMMPSAASPSLVVITDGVVKSNLLHGSTILRRLMELDVSCSIIQLGKNNESMATCNWGFIQDTEALRFVAEATLGKFMYSQDCISVGCLNNSNGLSEGRVAPNMYHRSFLIRELCLMKPRPGLDEDDKEDSPGYSLTNFPWDPRSLPEPAKMMQTSCKDYHLNIPVEMLVTTRIRQGFRIKGVFIALDKDRSSTERYMITMTLAWLPNVTIQYRLKGSISSEIASTNFFDRFEAPKVEIDVIAYQAFAIHFLNSQHAPVNANHSVYAKVYRFYRYIVGLSDSDVTLRGLNNSHAKSLERPGKPISGIANDERQELLAYISRLSDQWSGFAKDADYQYSRGWYNEFEFDLLMVVPPPSFLPTVMDTKNTLVKYSEGLEATIQTIKDNLKNTWASFVVGDVYIKTWQAPETSSSTTTNSSTTTGSSTTTSSQFCELRLFSEPSVAVLHVQLRFFGMPLAQRRSIAKALQETIYRFQPGQSERNSSLITGDEISQASILRCQRPIYRLLMRHLICEVPLAPEHETALMKFRTHVSEPIGEESVLRSYMVHKHWVWKDQVRDPAYLAENNYMASQDLAFQYLCAQRIGEGYLLASALPNRVLFYKEVDLPEQQHSLLRGSTSIQYLISRSPASGELVTELWMEPPLDMCRQNIFSKIKAQIIAVDRFVQSRLATYEAIHTIGRLRLRPEVNAQSEREFVYPYLFDPATLLRQQRLVTVAFEAPRQGLPRDDHFGSETEPQRKCIHTLGLGASNGEGLSGTLAATPSSSREFFMVRNANASTTSLTQSLLEAEAGASNENELVAEYKDQIRELCCRDRDLAMLHLFMEKSLSHLADGEIIPGGEDDGCTQLFMDIKLSIKQSAEVRQALMDFHCANSFQDIRCFVKSINSKFFRLIIIPKLGAVISHLTKLRSLPPREQDGRSEQMRRDFLSCLMFECLRSKPLVDLSEYNANALEQSMALFELHPVTLGPLTTQQPLLPQPVVYEDQGKARVQGSTIQLIHSISQAYSHSFIKAIYASLVEGHSIDSSDLANAIQFCSRTTVDINITGFLNTLEEGRRTGTLREDVNELSARFMNVLKRSFDLAPVQGSGQIYFYRPALKKLSTVKQVKPKNRKRSPSVSRSGSIDADLEDALAEVIESAERPLFLHLECSFQKPLTPVPDLEKANLKSSVTFPVTEVPVSYMYKDNGSQEYNYAPTSIGLESRPVDSGDGTIAILHLVISTLPMPEDYAGPTLKTIDSESKINVDNSQLTGLRSLQHLFPTLESTQIEVIAETEARLEWLVKEEVMHGLMNMTPITTDILSLVETQLKTKSNFVDFPTAMTLPLTFVKRRRGHDIFMQELSRTNMYPYELHQLGQYFYLTESSDAQVREDVSEDGMNDSGLQVDNETSQDDDLPSLSNGLQDDLSLQPSNDLCHGLGIVILPDPRPTKKPSTSQQNSSDHTLLRKRHTFWLILVPKDSFVQMYFFSRSLSEEFCNAIQDHVRKAINDLCIKVNQLTLLQSLNKTRNCSKYLVPCDETDPNADTESDPDSDEISEEDKALVTGGPKQTDDNETHRKFQPGEFACPLVYRVAWPLHWRVKAGQAVNSVFHLGLFPFAVQNRKNYFVVESQDDHDESKKIVVLLKLSEVDVQPDQDSSIAPQASEEQRGVASHFTANKAGDDSSAGQNAPIPIQSLDESVSHINSPRPSLTASPGSRTIVPPLIRTETRELVIEVFGVEPPGKQITVDLFNLLENRFYNSVVLNVVSTFLSRNSTLKFTQADVDFILPIDRLESTRRVLEIPNFIKVPYAFLMYLKQNLCLYLSPLTGPDKINVLARYYHAQYGRFPTTERSHDRTSQSHQLQIGDFSFFYNAVQSRTPTPIEACVGVGLAGVCLTVLGQDMRPVFEVGYQEGDHDREDIEKYFTLSPNTSGLKPSKYSLLIEVWPQGSVNPNALLDSIFQSFRQSLCDDIIETSIDQGLCPSARDRRNDIDQLDGEPLIGERIQRNFIDPSFMILQHAYQWKNPAVQSLMLQYSMPPWIMDSFLLELDEIMTDVSVHFSPLLIRSMADSNRYKEYRASSGTRKSFGDMTNVRFILIGGIQDLSDGYSSNYYGRRTSMGSERSHSRRSSLAEGASLHHSHKTSTHSSQQHPKRQLEDIKMYPNAVTTSAQDETMLTRNCFVMITANGFGLQAYTYNWSKTYHEFMFSGIEKIVRWHKDRMRLLDNILLQKMGLFHHVPSMLSPPPAPIALPPITQMTPAVVPSMIHNLPRTAVASSPHLGSNLRTGLTEPVIGTPNVSKTITATTTTSPKPQSTSAVISDVASLASLVEDQFPNRSRIPHVGTSIYGNDDSRAEQFKVSSSALPLISRSNAPAGTTSTQSRNQSQSTLSTEQSHSVNAVFNAGLDVDQILRDYCLEPLEAPRDEDQIQDEVQRHGKLFLDTFTYHIKNAEDQQNAYNVYQKWSKRYRDRKGSPNALHENMTISDLAIMLRSSRLLHFCRTPLLFTEFSSSLFQLAKDSSGVAAVSGQCLGGVNCKAVGGENASVSDPVVQWYSALAETFMREYSQYLATVGMQLLMYGESKFDKAVEPLHSGGPSFMSQFTVSQTLSVQSPAAFLFKSLQGGSIMCEVRLQGMFVCVTLYTLNRRYGRLKLAAPGFATAEANKQSLRAFTEQCARFKDRIHVNSFVYDFHLRYIHRILMESSKLSIPSSSITGMGFASAPSMSLPFSFDLLDVLHQFMQYHSRPAAYSRNRIYRGVYRMNVAPGETELPGHLFEYVIKNPQRYGFQAIHHQNRPRACFVSGRDLLTGYSGGSRRNVDDNLGSGQQGFGSENVGQNQGLKGFGVGANRGGLSSNPEKKTFGPHTRHTSHDSNLNTKRISRRMTASRSSHTIKESPILEEAGVEYVLVISDGERDSLGLTVHYYLLILREEEVVKKLEERHGPLVNAKDRLLAANHSLLVLRESSGSPGSINQGGIGSLAVGRSNVIGNQLQPAQPIGDEDGLVSEPKLLSVNQNANLPLQEKNSSEERLMDATELQERITERAVLGDVVRAAEVRLELMLKQAAQFFDRDSLWEMLLQGKIGNSGTTTTIQGINPFLVGPHPVNTPGTMLSTDAVDYLSHNTSNNQNHHGVGQDNALNSNAELGFADFLALGQRFHSTPLEEMEPDFREIIEAPGIDWGEVLSFLARFYSRWAREFMEHDETHISGVAHPTPEGTGGTTRLFGRRGSAEQSIRPSRGRRHLVIFNPHNRDLLVHFVVNINTSTAEERTWAKTGIKMMGSFGRSLTSKQQFARYGSKVQSPAGLNSRSSRRRNSGASSSSKLKPLLQPHSQLQALLLPPSHPSAAPAPKQNQAFLTRPSLSDTSARVSSMSSIARVASLAMSKVASRLQKSSSGSRETNSSSDPNADATTSRASSRAGSIILEDDTQSVTTATDNNVMDTTHLRLSPHRTGLSKEERPSSGLLNPERPVIRRTRKISGTSQSSQGSQHIGLGIEKSTRQRQSTTGSERFSEHITGGEKAGLIVDSERGPEDPDHSNSNAGESESLHHDKHVDVSVNEGKEEEDFDVDDTEEEYEDEDDEGTYEDEFDEAGANVQVFSVSREPKSGYNSIESEHVGDIIRTLSFWIWKMQK
ncbi:hypothetical protein BCR41DRAFT_133340 [Lobosporangium transversale]|uniref:Uncharacterized protein n=1 Tax=Lobosporangium transversale TaxID=64571 RepID=A0A1Y2GHT8_9FUNG|nr:hypothetical protein BCR41DRAFT_133340 [Lobosporangium transversale]ORZ10054.1 hypothetical protein BCR41DRAFT_133340 [Lobosporangium transversale]|eukprot:XP_021879144.1 hypothetical protein BCR41DRAFT_133340 [Lobosporangium transversale]